jgi:hypothetical protein
VDPCLKEELVTKEVQIKTVTGRNGPNETLGPVKKFNGYFQVNVSNVQIVDGTEKEADTVFWSEDEVTLDDRIWIPDLQPSNEAFSRRPRKISLRFDPETGKVDHYKVTI